MDLSGLRIGYVPHDTTLRRPGDRRRFCYWAQKRGLSFELADPREDYDLLVVTAAGDISVWNRYRSQRAKVIYDQIDAYLAIPRYDPKAVLRGLAKFLVHQNRHLMIDYRRGMEQMCRHADAVICTTAEQRQQILEFCPNVHIILDFHFGDVQTIKHDYARGARFNFVWEGLPWTLEAFSQIRPALRNLRRHHDFTLHAVTDLQFGRYLKGSVGRGRTLDLARRVSDGMLLYQWDQRTVASIVTACDLAIIPLVFHDPLYFGKPENKLLLLWRMAMPTVVSATPAYQRVMNQVGLPMACSDNAQWEETLARYMEDEQARRDAGQRGKVYVEENCREEHMLAQWDAVVASVFAQDVTPQPTMQGVV